MYSTIKRKTPLKAKTALKARKTLNTYKPLRASASIKPVADTKKNYTEKTKNNSKKPKSKITVYKPKYPYESIFTEDLKTCFITGTPSTCADIHVHHIFGASRKELSEKYHFLIPLRADWHDMEDYGIHFNRELDLKFKRECEEYYLSHYGTKEDFIAEFGQWW